jgi:hypothetical protein
MTRTTLSAVAACLAVGFGASAGAQEQEPHTARAYCLKVPSGGSAEFLALVRDAGIPAEKERIAAGESTRFDLLGGVVPAGTSARCDYLALFHYGEFPEAEPSENIATYLGRAGVEGDAAMTRWSELTELVSVQWWWYSESIGPAWPVGTYVQANFWEIPSDGFQDFAAVDGNGWRPVVEAALAKGKKVSWDQVGIFNPYPAAGGHSAITLDAFHDWETWATWQSVVSEEIWPEVYPNMTQEQNGILHGAVASIGRREVYRVVATTIE